MSNDSTTTVAAAAWPYQTNFQPDVAQHLLHTYHDDKERFSHVCAALARPPRWTTIRYARSRFADSDAALTALRTLVMASTQAAEQQVQERLVQRQEYREQFYLSRMARAAGRSDSAACEPDGNRDSTSPTDSSTINLAAEAVDPIHHATPPSKPIIDCHQYDAIFDATRVHDLLPDVLVMPLEGPRTKLAPASIQVIVDLGCGHSVLRGSDVFAPGIKAASVDMVEGTTVSVWADLEGKVEWGQRTEYTGKKLFLGNGRALISRHTLFRYQHGTKGVAVQMSEPIFYGPGLANLEPDFYLQNLPSALASHALQPQVGMRVLDMCAAPGGKTTHLADLVGPNGCVVALERSPKRAADLKAYVARCQLEHVVEVHQADATKAVQRPSDGKGMFPAGSFDAVLLDAPCSCLGQRPRLQVDIDLKSLLEFDGYQRKLLSVAADLVKVGGNLVYSTCTINARENEGVVGWAVKNLPQLQLTLAGPRIGRPGLTGHGLDEAGCALVQRFDPDDASVDSIGFFVAKFVRIT